jgi:D-threo-aldose 1-dehydrogenase
MRSHQDSLMRLGLPRVDLLVIHDLDYGFHRTKERVDAYLAQLSASGWRALAELRRAGLIRGVGVGVNERGMIPRFLDAIEPDFFLLAMRYTLLEQDVLDDELPRCSSAGVGIVIGSVFNSGILATGPIAGAKYNYENASPDVIGRVSRLSAICTSHGVPLAAAALQFPLGHPSVAAVVPGVLHPDQITQNDAHFRHLIPADLWSELKHARLIREDAPTPA